LFTGAAGIVTEGAGADSTEGCDGFITKYERSGAFVVVFATLGALD
jgi:hypothetical protein